MCDLIVQYGVYLGGSLLVPYNTPKEAYEYAKFVYEETGVFHEVREIKESSKF